jgi:eukaryotic-like serine/threonine-protein kinase
VKRLDPERWRILSPYLDEALELPDSGRSAWLDALRAKDATLAEAIEDYLEELGEVRQEHFLETGTSPSPVQPTLAGQRMGAYTLREKIGQGGMGGVWLADRTDGRYQGVAAVKLLNASLMGHEAEARFQREGSILARLRHPHIAHLIDAGLSPGGQPYLILEHVDGEHLDTHCDRRQLDVEARVTLFLDVLAAVSHAHANLIVHRDLKPSNVLVTKDGTVKLLDFGIAKLVEKEGGETITAITKIGDAVLTPQYAAPEQLTGGGITTATDVYALGVLLYVLLSGRHPAGEHVQTPADLVRAIVEGEAPPLSSAAVTVIGDAASIKSSALRAVTPRKLKDLLQGDLDNIVAQALKKRPDERYPSADALAADLRRYLAHEPVSARPDSITYRVAKFVRRNRLPVALAAVVLVALVSGLAGTVWQARAAARQRDLALAQLARAESINEFTAYLLGQMPSGQPVRVSEILTRAEHLVEKRFARDPTPAVDLQVTMGGIYAIREDADSARRLLKHAYETSQSLSDPATRAKAACAWARSVALDGDFDAARKLVDSGLALTSSEERFDGVVTGCLIDRGTIAMDAGDVDGVFASGQAALERLRERPDALPETRANALQMMAVAGRMRGDVAEANKMFAAAMDQLGVIGREDSTDAAVLLHNWALNAALTNPLEALALNRRVIDIFQGGGGPDSVPIPSRLNYAVMLNRLERYAEARAAHEQVREQAKKQGNVQSFGSSSVALAAACRGLGDLPCERAALRDAEGAIPGSYPKGHRVFADLAREQALLAAAEGRPDDALGLLTEAIAIHRKVPQKHASHVESLLERARLELRLGRMDDAARDAQEALTVAESFRGGTPQSAYVGLSLLVRAEIDAARGEEPRSRERLTEAVAQMEPTLGGEYPEVASAKARLAARPLATGAAVRAQEPVPQSPPAGQHLVGFYTGTLPCADCSGIRTELSLFAHGATSSGTASYWLRETYLGKPEKDATFESGGSWTTQPGQDDPKTTVYKLTEARSREDRFFLKVSDAELRMLDRSGRPIASKLDHTLKRWDKAGAP